MNLDNIIFQKFNGFDLQLLPSEVESITFQFFIAKTISRFSLSFLLSEQHIVNKDFNEITLKIASNDDLRTSYRLDLSDSLGKVYYEYKTIANEFQLVQAIESVKAFLGNEFIFKNNLLDEVIFRELNNVDRQLLPSEVKSITFQSFIKKEDSLFLLSFLLDERCVINVHCDEIVIEIDSNDTLKTNYDLDVSDSLGKIYYEYNTITDENQLVEAVDIAKLAVIQTIKKLVKD